MTVAVARVIDRRIVNVFTGPPKEKKMTTRMMYEFMHTEGKESCGRRNERQYCGASSEEIVTKVDSRNPDILRWQL